MGRVIFHSDMNSCFASIECLYDPSLRGKPVSVCGDVEARHGIVLASTPEAKRCGVRTGEAVWEAKRKCPELVTVLPHYDRYLKFSRLSREIYGEYTDKVEPFGLDEAFLDVTGYASLSGDGRELANEIRRRVKQELGITVSVGVADNKVFAKLGSDLKKPDAVTVLPRDTYRETVWPLPVGALLGVGRSTERKLTGCGITTIGALACCGEDFLRSFLGKMGSVLHSYANGMDRSPVLPVDDAAVIKSISNGTTPPRDMRSPEDAGIIITMLSESVASRLRRHKLLAKTVQVSLRDTALNRFQRQLTLSRPTDLAVELRDAALELTARNWNFKKPLRSLTVHASDLSSPSLPVQLSIFEDEERRQKSRSLELAVDELRSRFGADCIARGSVMLDPTLNGGSFGLKNVIYPFKQGGS